jgi:ion channel-forming bestrophin family protein
MITKYDPHDWTSHLCDIEGSLVREILGRVSLAVLLSAVVVLVHRYKLILGISIEIPETAHGFIGAALGLLLVFRTNASYDRFWEGRKLWGGIVNETRNIVRQGSVWLKEEPARVRELILWTTCFPHACRSRLRGLKELGPSAEKLPPNEVADVVAAEHAPLAVARKMTAVLENARRDGKLHDYAAVMSDQNIQLLIDYIGACERIHATPIPFAYAVHLRRALLMYCWTMPFALVGRWDWVTIPATLFISYILFGIEEIGVEIEDPFGTDENDLPLDEICGKIEKTLLDIMPERESLRG